MSITAEQKQLRLLLASACEGLESWKYLMPELLGKLPRQSDKSARASAQRYRILSAVLIRAKRLPEVWIETS